MCIVKGIFLKKLVTSAHDHVMIMVWQRYAHGISGMIGHWGKADVAFICVPGRPCEAF